MNKHVWFKLMEQAMKVEMALDSNNISAITEESPKLYNMIYGLAGNVSENEGWYEEFKRYMDGLLLVKNDR